MEYHGSKEDKQEDMREIKLEGSDFDKGYSILLHAGTVVYTGEEGRYIVPYSSVQLLKAENIKFEVCGLEKKVDGK